MAGGPGMAARPEKTPAVRPAPMAGPGPVGRRIFSSSAASPMATITASTTRITSGDSCVRPQRPRGVPTTAPIAMIPSVRYTTSPRVLRMSRSPTMHCRRMAMVTAWAGGRKRLSAGTAASAKPKPVSPLRTAAAKVVAHMRA